MSSGWRSLIDFSLVRLLELKLPEPWTCPCDASTCHSVLVSAGSASQDIMDVCVLTSDVFPIDRRIESIPKIVQEEWVAAQSTLDVNELRVAQFRCEMYQCMCSWRYFCVRRCRHPKRSFLRSVTLLKIKYVSVCEQYKSSSMSSVLLFNFFARFFFCTICIARSVWCAAVAFSFYCIHQALLAGMRSTELSLFRQHLVFAI